MRATGQRTRNTAGSTRNHTAYILAFLSGLAALVYQVVWVKILALSFGNTSAAAAAVISSFMAGLGLGAWGYRFLERRDANPFVIYGTIEIGIAVTAAVITPLLYSLPPIFGSLLGPAASGAQRLLVGFAVTFATIVIPSALMGATFPALSRAVIRSAHGLRASLGPIYGLNTVGSALGAVLAGFVMIETFGNLHSVWLANAVNLIVGLVAIYGLGRSTVDGRNTVSTGTEETPPVQHALPMWVVILTLVVSGFATMTYEILWIRAVKYLVGNSTYALSVVLAIFLVGLGIGGLLHRPIMRRRYPARDLVLCQLGIALFALIAVVLELWVLSSDRLWAEISVFAFQTSPEARLGLLLKGSVICAAILLPPTIWMGLSFPLASSLFVRRLSVLGRQLGSAYLFANLGSIVGVITGALVILTLFGTIGGTRLVAALNLLLALLILGMGRGETRSARPYIFAAVPICILLIVLLPSKMSFRGELERQSASRLLYWEEGDMATVKVLQHPQADMRGMTIDGYIIGVNAEYGQTTAQKQFFLAHLPMALAPDSRITLNIGLGSASTLAALGGYPQLDSLHCVEISRKVVEGARYFEASGILDDPRTTLFVDDAVHHLRANKTRYDIIISDAKQNPQFPGNATVLSREFLQLCRDRLSDSGIMVQWSTLSFHPTTFNVVLRTFMDTFENMDIYLYPPVCMVMVGYKSQRRISGHMVQPEFTAHTARRDLEPYFVTSPTQLLAGRAAGSDGLKAVVPTGEINTWDQPILEFIPQKYYKPEEAMKYYWDNLSTIIRAGENSAMPDAFREYPALEQSYGAARFLRLGTLKMIETSDATTLGPFINQALEIDPGNSIAAGLKESIPRGFVAIFNHPGRR